ncbi:MAG: helix-turn-helix transcriptional regulator [Pseudomonadota bacterium]
MDAPHLSQKGRSERLLELSVFLRHMRTRAAPVPDEADRRRTRRTRGLRREEVAARAGISTDWYTRIEQGRDVNPSSEVLDALSDALELSVSERDHLLALTDTTQGHLIGPPNHASGLTLLADQMPTAPAFVLDPSWTVLHQNQASIAQFGDWSRDTDGSSNFLVRFFTDPLMTNGIEDWTRHAKLTVRQYRAVFAKRIDDPAVRDVVRSLSKDSPDFADWWAGADVAGKDDGVKVFVNAKGERTTFDYVMVRHCEASDCELIAFIPRTGVQG